MRKDEHFDGELTPHDPRRRCILTGVEASRDTLIRLVLSPEGEVWPDVRARAPGRGAWMVPDRAALEEAIARKRFGKALARAFKRGDIRHATDLPDRIDQALARAFMDRLGLESRAGRLILGSDRIADAIAAGRVFLLLHASDAGEDGVSRLDGRLASSGRGSVVQVPVTRAEISMALGRENVVHAALGDPGAARRVEAALQRWRDYLGLNERPAASDSRSQAASPVEVNEGV